MKKSLLFVSAVAAVLLSSCMGSKETPTTFKSNDPQEAVKVKTKNVVSREVEQTAEFTSNVEADVVNNIAPQSPVRIRKIHTEVGRYVKKGDLLVEVDDASLVQMENTLMQARLDFTRTEQLYNVGGVSKSSYENAKVSIENAESQLANLKENTKLLAPCDGIVTARNYDNGDLYSGAQPILTVEKTYTVKLMLEVNEQYYRSVKVGMPIKEIKLDAYPGESFEGRVSIVYPTLDPQSRTFKMEVQMNNANQRVRPGMFARVTLGFGTMDHVLVPDQAVVKQQGSGERYVYVVKDGAAHHRTIKLGRRMGAEYETLEGLQAGEEVVVFGQTLLSDGRNVEVIK